MKKIIVFGNTVFTKAILETLHKSGKYEVCGWTSTAHHSVESKINTEKQLEPIMPNYSTNTKYYLNNPVERYCMENAIPVYVFDTSYYENESSRFAMLERLKPDLCIVVAYGKIIKQNFLDLPEHGFINIHGSLLPKLRGATPIQSAILNGMKETGLTIQKMVYKMDEGDILKQYNIKIDENDNFDTLRSKMIEKATADIVDFVDQYFKDEIKSIPQNSDEATYCWIKDFTRENGNIKWNSESQKIHNHIRAFYPEPVAWTKFKDKLLNIHSSTLTDIKSENIPGTMFFENKKLYVSTNDFDLEITELVLEGKRKMSGFDFGNGLVRKEKFELS